RTSVRVRGDMPATRSDTGAATGTPPAPSAPGSSPPGGRNASATAASVARSGAARPGALLQTGARASILPVSDQQPSASRTSPPTTRKESASPRSVSLTRASARAGDIPARSLVAMGAIHRQTGEREWEGVEAVAYDDPTVAGVEKRELIGPADGAPHYRLRHFHVP